MDILAVQRLLAKTGYYTAGLDGVLGPQTLKAVEVIERTQKKQYPSNVRWSDKRRAIAAAQAVLNAWKYEAGAVDGLAGHNTLEAFRAWDYFSTHGKREAVRRPALKSYSPPKATKGSQLPRQRDVAKFYGRPGKDIQRQLTSVILPFKVRIDWNLSSRTNRITVHRKCAPSLKTALIEVHKYYGEAKWRKLGLDRYAGAFNHRKMRGGSRWSMHAYGCAIDFYASKNGLRTRCPKALFCDREYKPFLDIMQAHGWLPAIRLWGADAMHFQRARM